MGTIRTVVQLSSAAREDVMGPFRVSPAGSEVLLVLPVPFEGSAIVCVTSPFLMGVLGVASFLALIIPNPALLVVLVCW